MNGQETEVKFYVRQLKRVERRLKEMGAHLIQPRTYELNLRFDLPDGSLRQAGKVLRLRQDEHARLTYKGPSQRSDGVLSRIELETVLDNFETGRKILEALEYTLVATYEKYRQTYELGNFHTMLDELPFGDFVEIEGMDVDSLQDSAERLGLDFSTAIPFSYLVLFDRLSQKLGLESSQLTFESLNGLQITQEDLGVIPADKI